MVRYLRPLFPAVALAAIVTLAAATIAYAASGWRPTGPLHHDRAFQSGTLLNDGRVLVAGGFAIDLVFTPPPPHLAGPPFLTSAEIYNPRTGRWSMTGSLHTSRAAQMSALLHSGKVLVAGGENEGGAMKSAELYDPHTGMWTVTGPMNEPRSDGTATLLEDGRVLVAGGAAGAFPVVTVSRTAEIYNPATGTWTMTAPMHSARVDASATVFRQGGDDQQGQFEGENSGRPGAPLILMAGGADNSGMATASAEIYDARTGKWTLTGSLNEARSDHVAALLPEDGKVLVAGGAPNAFESGPYKATAELYDVESGTWSRTGTMLAAHNEAEAAILLRNGRVLVSGGHFQPHQQGDTSELYNPESGTWSSAGTMSSKRAGHTSTLLRNGSVLVAGGLFGEGGHATSSADLYIPSGDAD